MTERIHGKIIQIISPEKQSKYVFPFNENAISPDDYIIMLETEQGKGILNKIICAFTPKTTKKHVIIPEEKFEELPLEKNSYLSINVENVDIKSEKVYRTVDLNSEENDA